MCLTMQHTTRIQYVVTKGIMSLFKIVHNKLLWICLLMKEITKNHLETHSKEKILNKDRIKSNFRKVNLSADR